MSKSNVKIKHEGKHSAKSSPDLLVSPDADKILRKKIFGIEYVALNIEDYGAKPFTGFLLYVDKKFAYVEVGSSSLKRPIIALISPNSLECIPKHVDREKVCVGFDGKTPKVTFVTPSSRSLYLSEVVAK